MSNPKSLHQQEQLLEILKFTKEAFAVYTSEDMRIAFINKAMLALWRKTDAIVGQDLLTVAPEFTVFMPLLRQVWQTGEAYVAKQTPANIDVDGVLKTCLFDFEYRPIIGQDGKVYAIINVATDVTELVTGQAELNKVNQTVTKLNENLERSIGNYKQANEQLKKRTENLEQAYIELKELNGKLRASDEQMRLAKQAAQLGTFDLDVQNDVLQWDERCKELFGVDSLASVSYGADFVKGLHPEDRERITGAVEAAFNQKQTDGKYDVAYRTVGATDGIIRHVRAIGQVYFNARAIPLRFIGSIMDISALKKVEAEKAIQEHQLLKLNQELATTNQQLVQANKQEYLANQLLVAEQLKLTESLALVKAGKEDFQRLIANATVGIVVLKGVHAQVEYVNHFYGNLIGYRVEQLLGKNLFEVIPEVAAHYQPIIDQVRTSKVAATLYDAPFTIHHKSENIYGFLNVVFQPYSSTGDYVDGVMVLCHDITPQTLARKEVETINAHLENIRAELRIAVDIASLGIWNLYPHSGRLELDERCEQIFGFEVGKTHYNLSEVRALIHPNYLASVEHTLSKAMDGEFGTVEYYVFDKSNGQQKWIRESFQLVAQPTFDEPKITGIVTDLSFEKNEEQRKSDFIGIVSHELRTPLTSISGYLQVLSMRSKKYNDLLGIEIAEKANRQTQRMANMISGFLDVVRLGETEIKLVKTSFDLVQTIHNCIAEAQVNLKTHQFLFERKPPLTICADEDKIEQVIGNFIANAVKYSATGSLIQLQLQEQGDKFKVLVFDEGIGVSEADIPFLFDRFYRVETSPLAGATGFGIGLYLCKEIIERHNGQVGVQSELGKGSCFWFTLPK